MADREYPYLAGERWLDCASAGGWIEVENRATEEFVGRVPCCCVGDMDRAVLVARRAGVFGRVRRDPVGAAAAVAPRNHPVELVGWNLGGRLAARCTLVIKHACKTPEAGIIGAPYWGRRKSGIGYEHGARVWRAPCPRSTSASAIASRAGNVTSQPESAEAQEAE